MQARERAPDRWSYVDSNEFLLLNICSWQYLLASCSSSSFTVVSSSSSSSYLLLTTSIHCDVTIILVARGRALPTVRCLRADVDFALERAESSTPSNTSSSELVKWLLSFFLLALSSSSLLFRFIRVSVLAPCSSSSSSLSSSFRVSLPVWSKASTV